MKITVISSKKKERNRERDFHEVIKAFTGKLSRIEEECSKIYANAKMSFSIDYFFKCYYKLVKAKKKYIVCVYKSKVKKILSLGMHQHISTSKYRELFGTMLIFFRYLLLCVHGAVGCCVT